MDNMHEITLYSANTNKCVGEVYMQVVPRIGEALIFKSDDKVITAIVQTITYVIDTSASRAEIVLHYTHIG